MIIIVSGLTASGKTTLAKGLSERLNFEYFSGSSELKKIIPKKDFKVWESKSGIDAIKFRLKNPKYDLKIDRYIKRYVKTRDNIVLDSWTAAFLIKRKDSIKILIRADYNIRAKRVAKRDGITLGEARKFTQEKDVLTAKIYKKLYNIDIINDTSPYDLIINSDKLDKNKLLSICETFIRYII